jgi:hypothetical protein
MNWTKQHQEFALSKSLPPSATLLWQWLTETGKEGAREPDLKEFNAWVDKHRGKPYHRDTLKLAITKLYEVGILIEEKFFRWNIRRVMLRSIEMLLAKLKPRKNSQGRDRFCEPDTSNLPEASDRGLAAAATDLLDQVGIVVSPELLKVVKKFSLEEIRCAVAHFLDRGGLLNIHNPAGWLSRCLRGRWWDDYYAPKGPRLKAVFNGGL